MIKSSVNYLKEPKFWLLCFSSFFFFMSFNMLIPELPNFYVNVVKGEKKDMGWIIACFTIVALISRPFSGKLTDSIGRIPVMIFGALASGIIALIYGLWASIIGFFTLRALHGLSTGFKPTATAAYVSDIIPENRRGEAMGILGMAGSLGMALGPAIGSYMYDINNNYFYLFFTSAATALCSIFIILGMKETYPNKEKFKLNLLKITKNDFFEPLVLAPSFVFLCCAFCYGTIIIIASDFSEFLEMNNKGIFYSYFLFSSLLIRLIAGKLSDKQGRTDILIFGLVLLILAMITIFFTTSKSVFLLGGILFGLSAGINSPTLYAWTTDLSNPLFKGRGFATMYIFMEAGITFGSLLAGWTYNGEADQIKQPFIYATLMAFIALLFILYYKQKTD